MSGAEFDKEFLYSVPACVMSHFTRIMDSLSHSDWILFGKMNVFIFIYSVFYLFNPNPR